VSGTGDDEASGHALFLQRSGGVEEAAMPVPGSATQLAAGGAERERLWALTSALARQDVLLGVQPMSVLLAAKNEGAKGKGGASGNTDGAAGSGSRSDVVAPHTQEVLAATQQLAQQQADLMKLVEATQQQLGEQRVRACMCVRPRE
jgi:hypothetical protein